MYAQSRAMGLAYDANTEPDDDEEEGSENANIKQICDFARANLSSKEMKDLVKALMAHAELKKREEELDIVGEDDVDVNPPAFSGQPLVGGGQRKAAQDSFLRMFPDARRIVADPYGVRPTPSPRQRAAQQLAFDNHQVSAAHKSFYEMFPDAARIKAAL
jgi:hypothetical protein